MARFEPSHNSPGVIPVVQMFSTPTPSSTCPSLHGRAMLQSIILCFAVLLLGAAGTTSLQTCRAQSTVDFSGLAYFDYSYLMNSANAEAKPRAIADGIVPGDVGILDERRRAALLRQDPPLCFEADSPVELIREREVRREVNPAVIEGVEALGLGVGRVHQVAVVEVGEAAEINR